MRKFPLYRQHDSMQCGITCLRMICAYWGKEYPAEYLDRLCGASREGVSLLGISETAAELGLKSVCARLTTGQLAEVELPAILHWNQNHFVVLYKISRKRGGKTVYHVADPGKGLRQYDGPSFEAGWIETRSRGEDKGIAMLAQPTPAFFSKRVPGKTERRSFTFLLGYLKRYRYYFGQVFLGLAVGSLLQLLFPFLTQAIVDLGIDHEDLGLIWLILLGQLALVTSQTALDFIQRWILLHVSMRVNISLVSDFFIKLLRLPMGFFDTRLMGDLMQRMGDHKRVEQYLTNEALTVLFSLLTFLVFGGVLLVYDPLIFAVFVAGSLLYGLWIAFFLGKRKRIDYELFEKEAENNNKTYRFITTMQEIKLQDCEQRRRWEWEDVQAGLFRVQAKSLKLRQAQEAGGILITQVKNILVTVLAATAVINGQMTLGMMLAVQYIIGQLNRPVEQLMRFIYASQDVKISLDRINEIHGQMEEEDGSESLKAYPDGEPGDLSLRRADFSYDPHAPRKTIDGVSLTIPRGKVTAIVGTSGSGKTTLVKLLLGFYPLLSGEIRVGRTPLGQLNKKWWRRQCGVVMQDGVIFSESIARNIAVDDGPIDTARLARAVEIANIKEFIQSLPLRYDTVIGPDGIGLSQGQKQRVLIARAVYKDPDYIFLDEATNALDANNEQAIVRNLDTFYKGKTVVIVAHRLSTVRHADQIIVIERGKIIETGDHQSLIDRRGAYYRLVSNQLELGN